MRNLPLQTAATDALLLLPRLADILKGLIACLGIAKARLHGRPAGSEEPGRQAHVSRCSSPLCQMPCLRSTLVVDLVDLCYGGTAKDHSSLFGDNQLKPYRRNALIMYIFRGA